MTNPFTIDFLAVWGAVTGTLGLIFSGINVYLRAKQVRNENIHIKIQPIFNWKFNFGISRESEIKVSSLGKKPVYLDSIEYFVRPKRFFDRLFRTRLHALDRWMFKQSLENVQIIESQSHTFPIKLREGVELDRVYKVFLVDSIGNRWSVPWKSSAFLKLFVTRIDLFKIENEDNENKIEVVGLKVHNYYIATVEINSKKYFQKSFRFIRFQRQNQISKYKIRLESGGIEKYLKTGINAAI